MASFCGSLDDFTHQTLLYIVTLLFRTRIYYFVVMFWLVLKNK